LSQFEQQRDSTYSRLTSARESPMASVKDWTPRSHYKPSGQLDQGGGHHFQGGSSVEPSRATTSSRDEPSISNASEMESEWVEQDEPGVYITIRQLADGTRELRRVRFRYYNASSKNMFITHS
jgi:hypothetical protein